jgi:hypothetical protein
MSVSRMVETINVLDEVITEEDKSHLLKSIHLLVNNITD